MKGKNTMRKLTYRYPSKAGAAIISAAMLLSMTACNTDKKTEVNTQAPGTADPTEAIINITEPDENTAQSDNNSGDPLSSSKKKAYSAYLEKLESLKDTISVYTWMNIGGGDSNWLYPQENIPCALYDLTGDGIEEMIVMEGQKNLSANLEVYSYNESTEETSVILFVGYLNPQIEIGRGVTVAATNDGRLLISDNPRDDSEYNSCITYAYNGFELLPDQSAEDLVSYTEDMSQKYHEYKINDGSVSESDYTEKMNKMIDSIDVLMQYGFVIGDKMQSKIEGMTSIAMSYDQLHEYLEQHL